VHEQSIVKNLLRQADQVRRAHNGQRLVEVRVEIGPLSGVEPALLQSAFLQLCNGDLLSSRLVIDEVDLIAQCKSCGGQFTVRDFCFRCPTCQGNVKVVQGDQIHLVSVQIGNDPLTGEVTT
jgi:hydrogenase nickel incorporation protein HypA/HybF